MNTKVKELLEFTRGESAWKDLHIPGMEVDFVRWKILEPAASPTLAATVSPTDVVLGFTRLIDDRWALRRWSFVILTASDHFAFSDEFESPAGQELLEALWDASFGEPIREEAILFIQKTTSNVPALDGPGCEGQSQPRRPKP